MTKDEVMKLALNFLEDGMPADMWGMDENGYQNAIAALRQALEQPPNSNTDVVESEPVAWCELNSIGEIMYFDGRAMIMPGKFGNDLHTVPLYAAPPKQEFVCSTGLCHYKHWVGLTDKEVGALTVFDGLHHVEVPLLSDFARAIEAKLRAKNGF